MVLQAAVEDNAMEIDPGLKAGWAKSQQGIAEMMEATCCLANQAPDCQTHRRELNLSDVDDNMVGNMVKRRGKKTPPTPFGGKKETRGVKAGFPQAQHKETSGV